MGSCLVVCPDLASVDRVRRLRSAHPIVVASDDPNVQSAAMRVPGVASTTFLDAGESFWTVADDVRAVITASNRGSARWNRRCLTI